MDEKLKELEKEFILKYAQESRAGNLDSCCSAGSVWNWITSNFNPLDALVRRDIIVAFASLHEVCDNLTDLMQDMVNNKDKRIVSARFHLKGMKKHVDKLRA